MTDPIVDPKNIPAAADLNINNPAETLSGQTPENRPSENNSQAADDDWASALAEQSDAASADAARSASDAIFKPLSGSANGIATDIEMIMDVPMQLTVELGRTRLTIKNLLQLGQGSVVELEGLAGEPMDIFVNSYLIAQGEVVVIDEKYGIRVTDIITPSERINRLNSHR
jgi:flagellar motor switch protein FliN